ncbi:MAG: PAS domain-containing protein [Deltaproteobacteria bacterium]|nr:PAS domain-containing protein [Deltaproteobacteria bacterium]
MVARGRELRLELALEAGVVGAWLYDAATHELTWEAPMYQIFRVPLGTPVTLEDFLARVHPDDRGRFEASIARTLEGSDFREEYRIITSRGERWVMIRAQLLTDGRKRMVTGVTFDVTERKEAEEARSALVRTLEGKNAELETALTRLQEARTELELSRRLAGLGQLVAGVSHEMNTPLGALKSALDTLGVVASRLDGLALPEEGQRLPKVVRASVEAARAAEERLTLVVGSLRSFSRLDQAPEETGSVDDCVRTVISLVEARAERVTLRFTQAAPTPPLVLRAREVQQALLTLVLNAVEAVQRRGEGEVRVRTEADAATVRVVIEDDGDGIDKEQLEGLLEPGFAGSGPRLGMRLGLSIAHRVATEHGGSLVISSAGRGHGARAVLTLARRA